jgi:hypothetical protein
MTYYRRDDEPQMPPGWWVPFGLVLVMLGVCWSCAAGCNSAAITEEADAARRTLTTEQEALATDVTDAFAGLVQLRDQIYETLTALMGSGDDVRDQAIEEARDRLTDQMTERLQALAERLKAHAAVLHAVVERLNKIYTMALDDAKLLSLLQSPLGFFGFPPSSPPTGNPPAGPKPSGGFPVGETILGVASLYGLYRGGRWGVGVYRSAKDKREAQAAEHRETIEFLKAQSRSDRSDPPPKAERAPQTASQRARRVTVSGDDYDIPGRN